MYDFHFFGIKWRVTPDFKEKNMIHTVKKGDTVYKIAKEYGVPLSRIVIDNGLNEPSRLAVGEDLVVRTPALTHTVRQGETLYSIAKMYGTTVLELWQNNPNLGGLTLIYPGQTLVISYVPERNLGDISVNGYAYPFIEEDVLRRTLPYLTYLSVFTYGIRQNGTLIPPVGDEKLINISKEYGTVPLMMLTSLTEDGNFSNELVSRVLSDEELKNKVLTEAVRTMKEKGYGGIDVDFEYISEKYAEVYSDFLRKLKELMGEDYVLFASLAPKSGPQMRGLLYEGHSYKDVGAAADKVLLMTYEWGYTYGPPMAVSPLNKVREVIEYGVSTIPSEKIFMGLPNYGYNWTLPYVRGKTAASSLSNVAAVDLAKEKNARIEFDEVAKAPFFNYYDVQPRGGTVKHEVWFQNARSVEALLGLVYEFGLDGASVWNIMKYFPALWSLLSSLFRIRKFG